MRVGYDSVNAEAIPTTAAVVGGYDDGKWKWTPADWSRFPTKAKIHITTQANPASYCYDCENGNGTPQDAVTFVRARAGHLQRSMVYAGLDTWYTQIEQLLRAADLLSWVVFWVALYDGKAELPTSVDVVGKQYADPGNYDVSIFENTIAGLDPAPAPTPTQEDPDMLVLQIGADPAHSGDNQGIWLLSGGAMFHIDDPYSAGNIGAQVKTAAVDYNQFVIFLAGSTNQAKGLFGYNQTDVASYLASLPAAS